MAQHDFVIDNGPGLAVRTDIQAALQALATQNSGTTEPGTMYAGMVWLDTSGGGNGVIKVRNQANSAWVNMSAVIGALGINKTLLKRTVFTSGGTWTPDAKTTLVRFIVQGAGGGGGGAGSAGSGVASAGGGGGGGYHERWLSGGWGASQTVTVGTGGAGGTAGGAGSAGGNSSVGTLCVAAGGGAGNAHTTRITTDSRGGVSSTGGGASGSGGTDFCTATALPGGDGFGGVVFGSSSTGVSGAGGNSYMGKGSGSAQEGVAGDTGKNYGGGGSGGCSNSATARNGGAGANGIVIIEEYV